MESNISLDYLADIASLCSLVYESEHRHNDNPLASYKNKNSDRYLALSKNWNRFTDIDQFPDIPNGINLCSGLILDIWHTNLQSTNSELVVLVFRGSDKRLDDWVTNTRWFTHFIRDKWNQWDQYDQVIHYMPYIIKQIIKRYPNSEIISAGHSLGGGLAQLAGYCSPKINIAYTFNSSPVTGYLSLSEDLRRQGQKDFTIYRIYEKGEILAYARNFTKKFWPISTKDPKIVRVPLEFTDGNPITQHSMSELEHRIFEQKDQVISRIKEEYLRSN